MYVLDTEQLLIIPCTGGSVVRQVMVVLDPVVEVENQRNGENYK